MDDYKYDDDCLYPEDDYMNNKISGKYDNKKLVMTIQDCEANCEHMSSKLKKYRDCDKRVAQMKLLRDCADICNVTAKYLARNSCFSKHIAHLCSIVCETCGKVCQKYPDSASQHCAKVCLHCAKECKKFAMGK